MVSPLGEGRRRDKEGRRGVLIESSKQIQVSGFRFQVSELFLSSKTRLLFLADCHVVLSTLARQHDLVFTSDLVFL